MKRFIYALLSFLAIFYTLRSVSCPTCVGRTMQGSRPFFEQGKIQYIQKSITISNDDNEQEEYPHEEENSDD